MLSLRLQPAVEFSAGFPVSLRLHSASVASPSATEEKRDCPSIPTIIATKTMKPRPFSLACRAACIALYSNRVTIHQGYSTPSSARVVQPHHGVNRLRPAAFQPFQDDIAPVPRLCARGG